MAGRYRIDSAAAPTLITDQVTGATFATTAAILAFDGLGVVVDSPQGDVQVNANVLAAAVGGGATAASVRSPAQIEGHEADEGASA